MTDTESAWQAWEGKRQAEELRGHGRRALRARLPPGRRPCPRHPSTHPLIECRDNPRDHDICFLGMPRDSVGRFLQNFPPSPSEVRRGDTLLLLSHFLTASPTFSSPFFYSRRFAF